MSGSGKPQPGDAAPARQRRRGHASTGPDAAPFDPQATALATELSAALKELHRALIRAQIGDDPALQNPYTALFALIHDPRFSWMAPLSQLIARIDQQVADGEIGDMDKLAELRVQAARLIGDGKDETLATFRMHHVMALQREPEAGLATGKLRKALARLPEAGR